VIVAPIDASSISYCATQERLFSQALELHGKFCLELHLKLSSLICVKVGQIRGYDLFRGAGHLAEGSIELRAVQVYQGDQDLWDCKAANYTNARTGLTLCLHCQELVLLAMPGSVV